MPKVGGYAHRGACIPCHVSMIYPALIGCALVNLGGSRRVERPGREHGVKEEQSNNRHLQLQSLSFSTGFAAMTVSLVVRFLRLSDMCRILFHHGVDDCITVRRVFAQ